MDAMSSRPITLRAYQSPRSRPGAGSTFALRRLLFVLIGLVQLAWQGASCAQMVFTGIPLTTVSDSFFEQSSIGFGFSIPGSGRVVGLGPDGRRTPDGAIHFAYRPSNALGPMGGRPPGSGLQGGFGHRGNRGGGSGLNFGFAQGSNRMLAQTTATVTVPNGGSGFFYSGTVTPFVTGFVPVVGGFASGPIVHPTPAAQMLPYARATGDGSEFAKPPYAMARRSASSHAARRPAVKTHAGKGRAAKANRLDASSAAQADESVSDIRRRRQAKQAHEVASLLNKAQLAIDDNKLAVAEVHLRSAARRASGEERQKILEQLKAVHRSRSE